MTHAILYEHADGRRAVVSANRLATFAIDNPDWHRAGPVEIVWVDDPIRWPKNAKEVREFFNSDFISAQFAAPDQSPCDDDRYYISAHDFLSAINWWADFPHHPSPPEGMVGGWVSVNERLPKPGMAVLLDIGKKTPIRAMWAAKHTVEAHDEADPGWCDYDETTDTHYCPEGWYEWNQHEEVHWAVSEKPRAWMPLPSPFSADEGGSNG